ncbi:hypothetical protein ACRPFF_05115 [Neisseria sp. SLRRB23]|uniref:hypothetical protein n=1 Tax=Neisseria sp. SLRRB23 TaxID=3435199 RepID=UPI003D7F90F5
MKCADALNKKCRLKPVWRFRRHFHVQTVSAAPAASRHKGNRLKQASAFLIPPAASRAFLWKYASDGKTPPETDTRHGRRTDLKTADYPSVLKALML